MAEFTKDENYEKRQEAFHAKLLQFHRVNNNPIKRFPLLGGKELDLYHLYLKVKSLGGSKRITQDRLWGEVARSFNLPPSVTSASYACRQNFIKYLEPYERYEAGEPVVFPPVTPSPRRLLFQPQTSTTPQSATTNNNPLLSKLPHLAASPMFSNLLRQLDKSPNLLGQIAAMPGLLQLPTNQLQIVQLLLQQLAAVQLEQQQLQRIAQKSGKTKFDWLTRSLQSGLPNEVDLAINCLLMVSSDTTAKTLLIPDSPQLLSILLAHVGVFSSDDPGLECLYCEWYPEDEQDFIAFWQEVAPHWVCLSSLPYHLLEEYPEIMECFPDKSVLTENSIECLRVAQVSMIVRNLSFDEANAQYLAQCEYILRFLLLSINSSLPQVRSNGLDTLANLAPFLVVDCSCDSISHSLLASLYSCVLSSDRHSILRGVEILGDLAGCMHNEDPLSQTPREIFHRIIQLSLLPDYLLVQTCLDSLYSLSFFGGRIGEMILQTEHCVSMLLSLLTLNIESLGPESLNGILVIHPDGKEELAVSTISATKEQATVKPTYTPQSTVKSNQSPVAAPTVTKTAPVVKTPLSTNDRVVASSVEQNSSHVPDAKSIFAAQWLQSEYVFSQEEFIPKLEIYSKYLAYCAQLKCTNAATQNEFDQILRKAFPHVLFTSVKISGQDIDLIGGIGVKKTPPTFSSPVPSTPACNSNSLKVKLQSQIPSQQSPSPSRSPSPSLSPLQQLIQATRSQNSTNRSLANPSPLLHSKKVSTGLKLKRPLVNGRPLPNSISSSASSVLTNPSESPHSDATPNDVIVMSSVGLNHPNLKVTNDTGMTRIGNQDPGTGLSPKDRLVNGVNDGIDLMALKTAAFRKRERTDENSPSKKQKIDSLCFPTNRSLLGVSNFTSINHNSNESLSTTSSVTSSSCVQKNSQDKRSISPDKRSTSPSVLSTASAPMLKPALSTCLTSLPGQITETGTISLSLAPSLMTNAVESKFACHWDNCHLNNSSYDDLFSHIYYSHLSQITTYPTPCLWTGCVSKCKRMKPSLLRHIQTHHCSSEPKPVPLSVADTLLKLKVVSPLQSEQESCFTRCLRLTVALILRNLLDKIPEAHRHLKPYERLLAQVAFSTNEASHVTAHCLFLLSSSSSPLH